MRCVVTGGAGFIGSALCLRLLEGGAEVLVIDKLTYAANPVTVELLARHPKLTLVQHDITYFGAMEAAINGFAPDIVFHLAAESHVDRSIDAAGVFIQTNIVGTHSVLEAARTYYESLSGPKADLFRFVHISTDEVYGSLGEDGLFTESTRFDPSSPYSASKAGSDHLVNAWHRTYGLPTIVSNCSNNYGPRQFPEKLIPLMTLNALFGDALPVYGAGENVRDWLHVEDHAAALELMALKGRVGETYNVGGNNELSNITMVREICSYMDEVNPQGAPHAELIQFVTDRPGHDLRYAVDATKISTELGWVPKKEARSGLRETIEWYLSNEQWWRPLRESVYSGQRLGRVNG